MSKTTKVLTNTEKLKLLDGYEKYDDPSTWNSIEVGTHIRLLKKNGDFIRGGFVKAFYTKDGVNYLMLESNKYNQANNFIFKVKLDDVKRIFVKPSTDLPIPQTKTLPELVSRDTDIQKEEIELLEKKIDLLEKIISQKDSEINSLRKRVGALETTTSGILKYLRQNAK